MPAEERRLKRAIVGAPAYAGQIGMIRVHVRAVSRRFPKTAILDAFLLAPSGP